MFESANQSYYEILDIKPDASQNEIRQAYFRAKGAYGKDSAALYSLFDEHETRAALDTIEQAYLVLSNPEKRKEYDKVHGFLRFEDMVPLTKKTNSNARVFSFGAGDVQQKSDAATEAASAMFGESNLFSEPTTTITLNKSQDVTQSVSQNTIRSADSFMSDYSTPRTLDSASLQRSPFDVDATSSRRNQSSSAEPVVAKKQGAGAEFKPSSLRRTDLVRSFEADSDMEIAIANEEGFRGEFLKKCREYRQVSIDELSDFTKISKSYLLNIEAENFSALPAGAYVRGFVVQFAKALKLSPEKVAAGYMAHFKKVTGK